MKLKGQKCNVVDCNGDALKAYHHLRFIWGIWSLGGICLGIFVIFVLFGAEIEEWKSILYGINRVYLLMMVGLLGSALVRFYKWLTKWDERKTLLAIQNQGLNPSEVIKDTNHGRIFYGAFIDSMLIAKTYSVIYLKEKYTIIYNKEVDKLIMDKQRVNGAITDVLVCMLQNGVIYDIPMNKSTITSVAQYFKQIMMANKEAE